MSLLTSMLRTTPSADRAHVRSLEADQRVFENVSRTEFSSYMEEAHEKVRLAFGYRWAICIATRDRYGLVADVAEALFDRGFNIEGAVEATIGQLVCLSFVASRDESVSSEELSSWLSRAVDLDRDNLFLTALNGRTRVVPDESYRLYHLYATLPDKPGQLARVTRTLAEEGGVLHNFTTGVQQSAPHPCVLDINVAVPPTADVDTTKRALARLAAELGGTIEFDSRKSPILKSLTITSTSWVEPPAGIRYAIVVGDADCGLVASVTEGLAAGGFSVVASSMAILAGRTAAIFGIVPHDSAEPIDIDSCLADAANEFGLDVELFEDAASHPDQRPEQPLIVRVHSKSREQTGVLARLARFLADRKVAIDRLSARVTGAGTANCVINMFVELPPGLTAEVLQQEIAQSPPAPDATVEVLPAGDFEYTLDY